MPKKKKNINQIITEIISKITKHESKKIKLTAKYIEDSHLSGGQLFLIGTGHNHCLAEEALHRAGGYANACPILDDRIDFSRGINKASKLERTKGVATELLKKYNIKSKDILVIFTNSGVNQAPIEAAYFAKKIKCKTVGISSKQYSKIAKKSKYKKELFEIVDLHIDNYGPPGDALIEIVNTVHIVKSLGPEDLIVLVVYLGL